MRYTGGRRAAAGCIQLEGLWPLDLNLAIESA